MTISDEDFHKMFDLVRELHENYTKAIERENETLRNMLAETQKQLDEAVDTLEKIKKGHEPAKDYDDLLKKFKEIQDKHPFATPIPSISPGYGPWTTPNQYPPVQWTTTGTTPPTCGGLTMSGSTSNTSHNTSIAATKVQEFYDKMVKTLYEKADEDG